MNISGLPIAFQRGHVSTAPNASKRKTLLELLRKLRISVAAASGADPHEDRRQEINALSGLPEEENERKNN
jgi:hypothetical protein